MIMIIRLILILLNVVLINAGFLLSFLIRHGLPIPQRNLISYQHNIVYLTLIYIFSLAIFSVYKSRFKSSFDLFKKTISGVFWGTLLSVVFIYIFRGKWGAFPTTVFTISFFVNLILLFKVNQIILKLCRKIKKRILVIGEGHVKDIAIGKADFESIKLDEIKDLGKYTDIDEIAVFSTPNEKDMGIIALFAQKMNVEVVFSPVCYAKLLFEKINGDGLTHPLATFVGRRRDTDEFMMRILDVFGSIIILAFSFPAIAVVAALIKLNSKGSFIYKQHRVGKDGKYFMLYKFKTMIDDVDKSTEHMLAVENDPRITKIGRFLRTTRFNEFPQLINVLRGEMSLVGPRPELPYNVKRHKVLREIRLAIRPGLTGLAQIRKYYGLHPDHKIKYDYLYIQRRSLFLNLYILAKTIPVMLLKKGR